MGHKAISELEKGNSKDEGSKTYLRHLEAGLLAKRGEKQMHISYNILGNRNGIKSFLCCTRFLCKQHKLIDLIISCGGKVSPGVSQECILHFIKCQVDELHINKLLGAPFFTDKCTDIVTIEELSI